MQNNNNLYRAYYTRYQCELIPMNKKILTIDCLIRKEKQRKENEINYDKKYENYCLKFQKNSTLILKAINLFRATSIFSRL